jgi:hypothetical protein
VFGPFIAQWNKFSSRSKQSEFGNDASIIEVSAARTQPTHYGSRLPGGLSKGFKSPNGHIHQLAQKVQGNMTFHAALSRAFRQPARGSGSLSGSMLVPADEHRSKLWLYTVTIMQRNKPLAVVDKTLAG